MRRLFQVELQRDEDSIFADDAVFENGVGGEIDYDRRKVYVGRLADTPTGTADHTHYMTSANCFDLTPQDKLKNSCSVIVSFNCCPHPPGCHK